MHNVDAITSASSRLFIHLRWKKNLKLLDQTDLGVPTPLCMMLLILADKYYIQLYKPQQPKQI